MIRVDMARAIGDAWKRAPLLSNPPLPATCRLVNAAWTAAAIFMISNLLERLLPRLTVAQGHPMPVRVDVARAIREAWSQAPRAGKSKR